jgi:lipopolysaccharide transport system permease protein/teichoic acid transport system permease protein
MKSLLNLIRQIYTSRHVIWSLAIKTLQSRYAGTTGGLLWSIIHPFMMIAVYWFVFSLGFRVRPMGDVPYIVFFMAGLIPWTFFSETLNANAQAIVANPHLVKKVVFPTEVLPIVNLIVACFTHVIMILVLIALILINHVPVSFFNFQFFYYLFALSVLSIGCGWFVAALNVVAKDTAQILGVVINFWFWWTPIVWSKEIIPAHLQWVIHLNPIFYIVEGYRNTFIYGVPFWSSVSLTLYFWVLCILFFVGGGLIFKRLKTEFADTL